MIQLFVSDIDGCLAEPYRPYDLAAFTHLRQVVTEAGRLGDVPGVPAFSLCSGRAYGYVEALSQVLGLQTPMLFESGGGIFDPISVRVEWHPSFTPDVERAIADVRQWLQTDILPQSTMMYDYGKRTQAGIIGPDFSEVEAREPLVRRYVAEHHPNLNVVHTSVSIDVVANGVTKRDGLLWLTRELGISLEGVAYIGDTHGDIPALEAVGASFAPANASDDVKRAVHVVTAAPVIHGVVEAYNACLDRNQRG